MSRTAWLASGLVAIACLNSALSRPAIAKSADGFGLLASDSQKRAPAPEPPPLKATLPPAQSIPVEPLGFAPPGQFYLGMRNTLASLDFLDETHLLFTFRVPGLVHRDPRNTEGSQERKIRAVLLELPQGTVKAETVWTVHDRERYLWAVGGGKFLLRNGENIEIGDASLQLKPFLHFPGDVLWLETDPANEYVLAGSSEPPATASRTSTASSPGTAPTLLDSDEKPPPAKPNLVLRILRRDSGQIMLVSHTQAAIHLPINRDGYLESIRGKANTWNLNLNFFGGGSQVLGSTESSCAPALDFISNSEILATGCTSSGDPRLVAFSTSGRKLWEQTPGTSVWPILVKGPDGTRVARETLFSNRSVNASSPLESEDVRGQDVQVLDAATGKLVLRAAASPILDAGGNVAISPSGQKVAILMAGGIQIFALPPAPPRPHDTTPQPEH